MPVGCQFAKLAIVPQIVIERIMVHASEDRFFSCPFCGEENCVTVDYTGGLDQQFVVDCEVCCKPIVVRAELTLEGIQSFSVEQES